MNTLFHLAFPVHDLVLAKEFYHKKLGFSLGRESEHALILNFDNHQIVAHKVDVKPCEQKSIYPRHFGLIFMEENEFNEFIERLKQHQVPFEIPVKTRFKGSKIEHRSFFLKDPGNNLLEFKYYSFASAIFGEREFEKIGDAP
ncbi:MAG: VOC family protein [Legionella sp.]|uniref:VOC family protein n=1 Tax=Legionella sp. TaxID=459 RepID=UPI0039E36283